MCIVLMYKFVYMCMHVRLWMCVHVCVCLSGNYRTLIVVALYM